MYLRVILKFWVPKDGAASRAWRHATLYPNMLVKSGSYMVFHMDRAGGGSSGLRSTNNNRMILYS